MLALLYQVELLEEGWLGIDTGIDAPVAAVGSQR